MTSKIKELPKTVLEWDDWDSGGGCIIWIHHSANDYKIYVSGDMISVSVYTTDHDLWSTDKGSAWLAYFYNLPAKSKKLREVICDNLAPLIGSECAKTVAADTVEIYNYLRR
jgi:hypothetical protein